MTRRDYYVFHVDAPPTLDNPNTVTFTLEQNGWGFEEPSYPAFLYQTNMIPGVTFTWCLN